MGTQTPTCVNHPRTETKLACSACGDPICTQCMRPSAVGQKCPDCARQPRGARLMGKPIHYVRAVAAGGSLAVLGGLAVASIDFGSIILSAVLGFGVARTVKWGASGQSQQPFQGLAIGLALAGIAVGYTLRFGTPVPSSVWLLLAYAAAGWFALRGMQS